MNLLALATVIIQLNLDGQHTAASVMLLPPPAGFQWVTCVQEFDAKEIRCYAVNTKTMELRYEDFKLAE